MLVPEAAEQLQPGTGTSRRNSPQKAMSLQILGGLLLVCAGLLLGTSWTIQALQPTLRRQAKERRKLNEEWLAVNAARRQCDECPRCGGPLPSKRDRYFAPTVVEVGPEDR